MTDHQIGIGSLYVAAVTGVGTWLAVPQFQPAWLKRRRNLIEITSPRPNEILRGSKRLGPGLCYRVTGRLEVLPKDHRIWLLVQPWESSNFWPQGFEQVVYDPVTKEWSGFIFEPSGQAKLTIFAVVAPPSAQAFFEYYQKHGNATRWSPLREIPAECNNRQRMDAQTQ